MDITMRLDVIVQFSLLFRGDCTPGDSVVLCLIVKTLCYCLQSVTI